jgi:hypothetical protein
MSLKKLTATLIVAYFFNCGCFPMIVTKQHNNSNSILHLNLIKRDSFDIVSDYFNSKITAVPAILFCNLTIGEDVRGCIQTFPD